MSTLSKSIERELVQASRRLATQPSTSRRRVVTRPPLLAALTALTVAGSAAVAATQPWRPDSIRAIGAQAPPISAARAPLQQARLLGVLRRSVTAADRSAAVDRLVGFAGSARSTHGVRTDLTRRLGTTASGKPIVLISLLDWTPGFGYHKRNPLCVLYPDVDGAGKSCFTTTEIRTGQASASLGTHTYGLVPDGVASVSILYRTGPPVLARATGNFFDTAASRLAPRLASEPATAAAPQAITWLDASGKTIGP